MESATLPPAGASDGTEESGTSVPFVSPRPSLRYSANRYSKITATWPPDLPADSRREYIGFFLQNASSPVLAVPALGNPSAGVNLYSTQIIYEIWYDTHGPLVRDSWTFDDGGGVGDLTIITITPEG